jgi:hypothetical protein
MIVRMFSEISKVVTIAHMVSSKAPYLRKDGLVCWTLGAWARSFASLSSLKSIYNLMHLVGPFGVLQI